MRVRQGPADDNWITGSCAVKRTRAGQLKSSFYFLNNNIMTYYINVEKFGKEETAKLLGTSPASLYRDVKDAD